MPPIIRTWVPVAAGFYTQWSFLVGAPFHWLAAFSANQTAYVGSATANQRDSYLFGPGVIKADETLLDMRIRAWLRWRGSPSPLNARIVPFYRLGTTDTDIDPVGWPILCPDQDNPTNAGDWFQAPDFVIAGLQVNQLIPSTGPLNRLAPQFGVRNVTPRGVDMDALQVETTTRPYSDRATMAGHRGWTRRRAV